VLCGATPELCTHFEAVFVPSSEQTMGFCWGLHAACKEGTHWGSLEQS